ncbi:MAG TPA: DUF2800 domain-containing protein [Candidatus Udaeobacter sp.]|nr:DUF2800 domain-containing protein [Candidatus Udaeobacter sp.]
MTAEDHHKTLAPSSFNALQRCAHYLSSGEESPASARGTRIHLVTAEMLRKTLAKEPMETVWLKEFDELEACNWLWKKTQEELREIHGIEERVDIWDPLAGKLITFGRCDCYGEHTMGIPGLVDWKSGNEGDHLPQLSIYALGLMDKLGVSEVAASLLYCDVKVVRRFTITKDEAEALLSSTIAAQNDPESPYVTGSYCRGCRLRSSCPAWVEPATKALVTLGAGEEMLDRIGALEKLKSDPILLGKFIHEWRVLEKLVANADLTAKGIEYAEKGDGMENWRVEVRKGRSHFSKEAVRLLLESDLNNEELSEVLKIDGVAFDKLKKDIFLPRNQLPDYKCLVWAGNGDK